MTPQPTLTLTGTGNLRIHIPMRIRRMRGRKMIFAPQALDGEDPDSWNPCGSLAIPFRTVSRATPSLTDRTRLSDTNALLAPEVKSFSRLQLEIFRLSPDIALKAALSGSPAEHTNGQNRGDGFQIRFLSGQAVRARGGPLLQAGRNGWFPTRNRHSTS